MASLDTPELMYDFGLNPENLEITEQGRDAWREVADYFIEAVEDGAKVDLEGYSRFVDSEIDSLMSNDEVSTDDWRIQQNIEYLAGDVMREVYDEVTGEEASSYSGLIDAFARPSDSTGSYRSMGEME